MKTLKNAYTLLFILILLTIALPAFAAPLLQVSSTTNIPNPLNISTVGNSDWRVFNSLTSTDMSGGNGQISNYSVVGTGVSVSALPWTSVVSWTNGNGAVPNATNNSTALMIWPVVGTTQGFSFTVPANTNIQTLYFYGATSTAANTPGTLTVSISDGSNPTYVDSSYSYSSVMYAISFSAASANQKLTVTWTTTGIINQNNYVEIMAAALANGIGPLGITSNSLSLPPATQYQTNYSAPALTAIGGTPPYTWSITAAGTTLPEGMTLNPTTGVISTPVNGQVGGQGDYTFQVQVKDSTGLTATAFLTLNVTADNTLGGCGIFPVDSIFHQRVDSLPVDNSPAAPIPAAYVTGNIIPLMGSNVARGPIPFIRVPWNQNKTNIQWLAYGSQSDNPTSSPTNPLTDTIPQYPFPTNAPIQGSANDIGQDQHVSVLQTAGNGKGCQLYEVWEGAQPNTMVNGVLFNWTAANGAHWDLSSDALRPLGWTSADAAGLPIMPLTVNYDETCPGGQNSPTSPCSGTINHPIRFTLNSTLNAFVWPARHTSGVGSCTNANGTTTNQNQLLSQSNPPVSCTFSAPEGEIYRLAKTVTINGKSVASSTLCPASTNPQAAAILTAMQNYGVILADNGLTGGLIGTPDARWNNSDLGCLQNISLGYLQPVNVSSLQVNPDSGATTKLSVNLTAVNTAAGTIVLSATASEANGTVTGVVFNSISNGVSSQITGTEQNNPPAYSMTLVNQPSGATETFTATVTDSNNVSVTSAPVSLTVPISTNLITTTVGANGTLSPMNPNVALGANQTFTLSPAVGFKVNQVLVDGNPMTVANNTFTISNVTTTHSVSATFTALTYLISTSAGANGSINPMNPIITYGANQVFTVMPATGYQVNQVLVDGNPVTVSNNSFTLSNVTAPHTISATFSPIVAVVQATPPSAPTGLTATPGSAGYPVNPTTQIYLAWGPSKASTLPVSGYKIYRAGVLVGSSTTPSYTDTGLTPSTTYTYTVSAYDTAGNISAQSISVSTSTYALMANAVVSNITANSALITWNSGFVGTSRLDYGLTSAYGSLGGSGTTGVSHMATLVGLKANTVYHFRARSNASPFSGVTADQTFTTI